MKRRATDWRRRLRRVMVMLRSMDKWLAGYLRSVGRRPRGVAGTKHLVFCLADHFEPFQDKAPKAVALETLRRWCRELPAVVKDLHDADGCSPRHTFFYPQEEYDADCLQQLAGLCAKGLGEVEIHLHHRHDTPAGFELRLNGFRDLLRGKHGLLGADRTGAARYGFVHGNWALCNSRPDGDWCGVDDELGILRKTGCYADFTFPSAPSPTQPRLVNSIYRATDTGKPGGCDHGIPVKSGAPGLPDISSLMLVTGPLALNWQDRKWLLLPRVENGALHSVNPPTPRRVDSWVRQHVHIEGRPEWVFVKVYTHGCRCADVLLGGPMRRAYEYLSSAYNDGAEWKLHFASAREMYNIIRAAEDGKSGSPSEFRDYEISRPPVMIRCGNES